MSDEATKDAIRAAVDEATAALKTKNSELIAELRDARKGKTIDPAELDKRDEQIEQLQQALSAAEKQAKSLQGETEKFKKQAESEAQAVQKLLIDNGLTEALAKAGVTNPAHLKAAKAMLAPMVQIAAEGDTRIAKLGDKGVSDAIAEWAKGDEGRHFVLAPNNAGGGANGGGNGGAPRGQAPKRADFTDEIDYHKAAAAHSIQARAS